MASFTDTQLPKFNPYIAQQPVEAMVAVGTGKQKAHDEGVQKIQTQIDNISGLHIARDVDKAYLQSKMNQLGNNLRAVAGGDFSNFQLVNSVGGMTKQLVNDPYIKSAVTSTANDEKERALMDEDRKSGKLTPQAEYFYNLKRQKYYNNPNLKEEDGSPISFNGKYIESWDLDKNILEEIKAVGDSKWTSDNVFKLVNGRIAHDKNGNPIYSEYATRAKREGKFSENVEAAINNVLARPEARQELNMRGVYNYRNYNNINDFVKQYESEKKKAVSNLEAKKFDMMEKVANTTNPAEKAQYQAMVNSIDSKIEETKQDAEIKVSQAMEFGSLEGYKAALETMKVKNSYMKSGVTEQQTTEIIENIPWKAQRDVLNEERKWKMDLDASSRGWAGIQLQREQQAFEREKWDKDPKNPKNVVKKPATPTELSLGNEYRSLYGDFINSANDADANMESTKFDIVSEYMSAINHGNGKPFTKASIDAAIKKYEKNAPGYIDRMYNRAKSVAENPSLARNPLYSGLITKLPIASMAEAEVNNVSTTIKAMNNSPEVLAAGGKDIDTKAITKSFKPFEVEYATDIDQKSSLMGGTRGLFQAPKLTKKTVTAQDAIDLAIIAGNTGGLQGVWKSLTNSPVQKAQYEAADARIKNKFGVDGRELLEQTGQVYSGGGVVPMPNESFRKVQQIVGTQKFANVQNAKEKFLANRSLTAQPLAYSVYDVDMKGPERASVDDRVKGVLNKYKSVGGLEEFNKLYTDPKKFSAQISADRGTVFNPSETFKLNLYDAGNLVKSIPVSKEDVEYIKQSQLNLPPRPSEVSQRLEVGGGTSNATGMSPSNPDAYKGAFIPATYYARKLNTTRVLGADVVQNPIGGYNAYLYTTDPKTGYKVGIPIKHNKEDIYPATFDSPDAANSFLINGIDNKAFVESLLKNGL